jgi:UDP-4-amino-4,6-dideoxy-N-acetyl-beta-L-altrosamine transaminase
MIKYGSQTINEDDINAVLTVLKSEFLTQGPVVKQFEQAISTYSGSRHAVAVNSATSALHIACLALGVGDGDLVWTSPNTFVASANVALLCGADIDFVDIDPATYNMCPIKLEAKLKVATKLNRLPKVLTVVHLAGQSCDMVAIKKLSEQYGFAVIEDASHAIGGTYHGTCVGSCAFSDVTVFSFHPVKIITSAEGGMALTNDDALAQRMRLFSSHGVTRDHQLYEQEILGPWYYEQIELGYNYRMTELSAALGLSQSNKIDAFVTCRNELAIIYNAAFKDTSMRLPIIVDNNIKSSFHLYVARLPASTTQTQHREFVDGLLAKGIGANLHYMPVYLQPYYRKLGFERGYCPEAEAYALTAISLPLHPSLTNEEQQQVINAVFASLEAVYDS